VPSARPAIQALEDRLLLSYFPTTTTGIAVFEDQLPQLDNALTQFMAAHTDGTQKQTLSEINAFRAFNPSYTMLEYQLGTGNSPYDFILDDQWASDWSYVNSQEAFFAHQSYSTEPQTAGNLASGRVSNSTGWDQADIANPAWQQYTINSVLQNIASSGANGWFADSFTYGFGGAGYSGTIPVRYQSTNAINPADWPGGVTWDQALGNWVNTIESAFATYNASNGTNLKFIPNLDALTTSWMPTAWYQNVDGAFLESFGNVGAGYDDPSPSDWVLSMNRGLALSGANKIVIMQPYLDDSNPDSAAAIQQREYLLGTYLLLQGEYTYLNISEGGVDPYYFPEYQLNLGAAATPVPANVSSYLWNGVYRRNFQNGFVLVNPNASTYTLNLGGTYQLATPSGGGILTDADLDANGNYIGGTLTYQSLSSVTLGPGSAAVFVNATSSPLTITTPASAGTNPVIGTSVSLSVLGRENGSGTGLTYRWSSSGPATVSFSDNGDNTARNATATFAHSGSYTFTATISDGNGQSVTSSVVVIVDQTLAEVVVSPTSANVPAGTTQQFSATAVDQFGNPLTTAPPITWSIASGGTGTVNASGLYAAPVAGTGTATVIATSGAVSGTASINVVAVGPTGTIATDLPLFTWATIPGTASYKLWLTDHSTGQILVITNLTGTSWTPTRPLLLGDKYTWWIGAVSGQTVTWNNGLDFTITPIAAGPAGTISSNVPVFTWTGVTGAASYKVWLTDQTAGQTVVVSNLSGTSWTPAQVLTLGDNYTWWVAAVQGQTVAWSSAVNFRIAPVGSGPSGTIATNAPVFSWNNVTGAAYYKLWLTDQTTGQTVVVPNLTSTSWLPSQPLTLGDSYTWWVGAGSGQSVAWDNALNFRIAPTATAPSGPISVTTPVFAWNSVVGAVSYKVWLTDRTTGQTLVVSNLTSTSWTPANPLTRGDSYIWWVGAVANSETVAWDSPLSFTI
jgi:hypothetical protein